MLIMRSSFHNAVMAERSPELFSTELSVSIEFTCAARGTADHKVVQFWVTDGIFFPLTKETNSHLHYKFQN